MPGAPGVNSCFASRIQIRSAWSITTRAGADWVKKRTVAGAEDRLYRDLTWAGLTWDEGPLVGGPHGPYRQSERLALYKTHIDTLLQNGTAYRCFCSTERIDNLNRLRHDKGLPLGYDRKCIDLPPADVEQRIESGESHVVRFRAPKDYPKYHDLVYGKSGHGDAKSKQHLADEPVYDDPILIKSDGFPTYHFANVVDDKLMHITHVIRGSEWMSSTPLHVALYNAFGWSPPQYGHVPLLVDHNKQKLSKRNFDSDISSFRDKQAIFPETLTNFAALLGWSHQQKSDVMDLAQLEATFDLKITKGNTIVAFEKLGYLQEQHARRRVRAAGEEFEQLIRDVAVVLLEKYGAGVINDFIAKRPLRDVLASMLKSESLSFQNPTQFVHSIDIFIVPRPNTRPSLKDIVTDASVLPQLRVAASTLLLVPDSAWTRETHRENLAQLDVSSPFENDVAPPDREKYSKKMLYRFLRWALLDGAQGPAIPDSMEILGRERCLSRIREAVLVARDLGNEMTGAEIRVKRVPKGEWQAHSLPAV